MLEKALAAKVFVSEDAKEGPQAFTEKRPRASRDARGRCGMAHCSADDLLVHEPAVVGLVQAEEAAEDAFVVVADARPGAHVAWLQLVFTYAP